MALEITFLGTGSAFTDYRLNYHNNAIVWTSEGPVLIDCGPTAMQSMREIGVRLHDVAAILVTHLHGDHTGGIEQFSWERFYTGGAFGPSWSRTPVRSTARILADVRTSLWACMDEWTDDRGAHRGGYDSIVAASEVPDGAPFEIGGVAFQLHRTPHVTAGEIDKPAYGVRVWSVENPRETFYFTSDTRFVADVGDRFPTGAIFHDTTFQPIHPGSVHTHYAELKTLPAAARSRVVLMHHTVVPDGVDPLVDGFRNAAARHDTFDWTGARVRR